MRPAATALVALAFVITGAGSYAAFRREDSSSTWAVAIGVPVVLGGVAAAWARREDFLGEWLRPRWGDVTLSMLSGGALYAAAWAFVHFVAPVGSRREIWLVPLYGQIGDPRIVQAHAGVLAVSLGAAALGEELTWRGMVPQLLAERVGSRAAWAWSTLLYVLAYVPTVSALRTAAGLNPILVLAAAAVGVACAGLARITGRLLPGVIAHTVFACGVAIVAPLWGPFSLVA